MLKEIQDSEIECDICGRKEEGDIRSFFLSGWSLMTKKRSEWETITVCRGCSYTRRFGKKVNISLYSERDLVLKKWAELEAE